MKRFLIVWVMLCSLIQSRAQNAEATLPTVNTDGFYRIFLSPEASSFSNREFSNIRIHDADRKEVPYLFQEESPTYSQQYFRTYEIAEKKQERGCCTTLILDNPDRRPISNINLIIKNADVTKEAVLSGSDDKVQWFAIKERFLIHAVANENGTAAIKDINFPLSNYRYYSLQIADSVNNPLNIVSAGYYDVLTSDGAYTEVSAKTILTTDTTANKKTYLHMVFDTLRLMDKVVLSMTGAPYFKRNAVVYEKQERLSKKGKKYAYYEPLTSFAISSADASVVHLPGVKAKEIMIVVDNEDNPPLSVASLKTYQLNRYLVTWLKKDAPYKLVFTRNPLPPPDYDISYFRKDIPEQPQILSVGEVQIIDADQVKEKSPTFFTNRKIIWIAIVAVIGVLGVMSVRLMKDAAEKKE